MKNYNNLTDIIKLFFLFQIIFTFYKTQMYVKLTESQWSRHLEAKETVAQYFLFRRVSYAKRIEFQADNGMHILSGRIKR